MVTLTLQEAHEVAIPAYSPDMVLEGLIILPWRPE